MATIDGGLEELNDEFSDGKVQFAYAKVIDPNTELPKFVFIGWVRCIYPKVQRNRVLHYGSLLVWQRCTRVEKSLLQLSTERCIQVFQGKNRQHAPQTSPFMLIFI